MDSTFVQHSRQDPGKARSVGEGSEGIKVSPLRVMAASLSSVFLGQDHKALESSSCLGAGHEAICSALCHALARTENASFLAVAASLQVSAS